MPDAPTSSISTIAGSYVDAKFSSDGSQLYAVSGNTVSVIDVATDQVVAQYTMGTQLGALDLSVDGHYLAVVENYASTDTVYRIDLTSGAITSYAATLTTSGPLYDIAFLPDGSALVSQRPIGNGNPSLELLDFSTGTFSAVAPNIDAGTLTTSADHSHVLIEPYGYQLASYLYVAGSGIVATATAGPSDPYAGAALPPAGNGVEATSPAGDMYVQGTTLNVYDSSLHLLPTPATDYPYLAGAQGLAFSPDGQELYVAEGTMVVVFNTSNWDAIGAYSVDSSVAISDDSTSGKYVGFGDIAQVSPDGHHLSVITSNGIELIDLTSAQYASTPGDDTIAGSGAIYALGGNDDLTGTSSWGTWMYGGTGDDTYHVNNVYDEPEELPGQGHDTVDATVSFTLGANIEDLVLQGSNAINGNGNDLDNLIVGNSAANQLGGGAGNDHLEGSDGDDTLDGGAGDDILDGGSGTDTVTYLSALSGVSVDLSRTGPQNTRGAGTDTLISIENLTGSWQDDHLTGDTGANHIDGYVGDDVLTGGLGADTLVGGDGSDTFMDTAAGLNGDTLVDFSSADKIIITDANLNNFQFSLSGNVLTYSGGSLTLGSSVTGTIVASAARGGGVQLAIGPAQGATNDQIAEQLTSGYWAGDVHHWDVTQGGSLTVDIHTLTPDEQALATAALAEWSDIIGVQFQQVTSGADIVFEDTGDPAGNDPVAQTFSNWSGGIMTSAEVQITQSWVSEYGTSLNSYGFQTYVHEIGHALGLGHAGNYNEDATYPDDALFVNDSWATSVMSYFSPSENTFFSSQGFSGLYSVTPMVADDVAMQTLYGLSPTTRLGDTIYGDHSNAGGVFDASVYPDVAVTIYDSGGNDTIDYSLAYAAQLINLNPETFSNVNGYVGNLEIARGVVIENAIGGSAPDVLIGNSAANVLTGNGGNDVLTGGGGGDSFLDTEAGHNGDTITDFQVDDRIVFSDASLANFSFSLSGDTLTYSGGSMTLQDLPAGTLVAKAAPEGGVQLTIIPENMHNDFGGDAMSDMLLRDGTSNWLTDWSGTSTGALVNNGADSTQYFGPDWHVLGTGDFNGDGRADVMLGNDSGWITDWLGTYNGGFANNGASTSVHFASNWQVAGTGDFNGDGISDFLLRDTTGGWLTEWLGNASGGFTNNGANSTEYFSSDWHIVGTGDFNGDGTSDFLLRSDAGWVTDWLGTSTGGFTNNGANASLYFTSDWHVIGTGDFNGDGISDILLRSDAGWVTDWLGTSSGGFTNNGANASILFSSDWNIASIGDFNGDGHDDLLLRSDAGWTTDWLGTASGGFTNNGAHFSTYIAPEWHVQDPFM